MKLLSPLLALAAAAMLTSESPADTLTIVADEWCPYNCAEKAAHPGFLVEFTREIFSKAGHTVHYKVVPWARALGEVRSGKHTALLGVVPEEAPDLVYPSEPAWQSVNGFYVKKGNPWRFTGRDSLRTVTLGAIIGYSYGPGIQEYIEKHSSNPKLVQMSSGEEPLHTNIRKLLADRIQVVAEDLAVMQHYMSEQKLDDKIELAGTSEPQPIYISFSPSDPKSKEYSLLFSEGMKELISTGEINEIMNKYGVRVPPKG